MTADVLIVADEVDDIRKYIPTIVESFGLVHNKILVDIASPVHANSGRVYRAKRLLLLLCGSKERAITICQQWRRSLTVTRFTNDKTLAVTTMSTKQNVSTDDSVKTAGCTMVCCESLDRIEDWVPEYVQTFFPLWNNHDTRLGIYNRSPEYPLATEITDSLVKTLIRLGMKIHHDTVSPDEPLKCDQEVKSCVFVLRSNLTRNQDFLDELHNNNKDGSNIKHAHIVSTQHSRITDTGSSPVHNNGSTPVQNIYGRLDIIEFILTLLIARRLVKPLNTVGKLFAFLIRQSRPIAILLLKIILTFVVFVMNLIYGVVLIILFPLFHLVVYDILMDVLHVKNERRCVYEVNGQPVNRIRDGSSCIVTDTDPFIYNFILTAFFIVVCWTVGLILDLASIPTLLVITLVIILCLDIWYSILHICLFKCKLGYGFGAFSLPYVWWQ